MIGATWNTRSLGRPGRKQAVADFILEHKIEFVGFQETKKEKIDTSYLNYISGRFLFNWFSLPANKTAGGILIGFRDDLFEVINTSFRNYCVVSLVRNILSGNVPLCMVLPTLNTKLSSLLNYTM